MLASADKICQKPPRRCFQRWNLKIRLTDPIPHGEMGTVEMIDPRRQNDIYPSSVLKTGSTRGFRYSVAEYPEAITYLLEQPTIVLKRKNASVRSDHRVARTQKRSGTCRHSSVPELGEDLDDDEDGRDEALTTAPMITAAFQTTRQELELRASNVMTRDAM